MGEKIKWTAYQKILVPNIPPHEQDNIFLEDVRQTIRDSQEYIARWISHWDKEDKGEFWYIIK